MNEDREKQLVDRLISMLQEGLHPLVRDGLIDENRATERAHNIAAILLGNFEMELIDG